MSKNSLVKSRSCIGKTKHKSYADALQERKNINCSGKIDIYKCSFCYYYHIGHTNKGIG